MSLNRIEQTRLQLLQEGKTIINLSSGNPGEFGINFPLEILAEAFQNFQNYPIYSPDPKGNLEARKAISDFYKKTASNHQAEKKPENNQTAENFVHTQPTANFSPHPQNIILTSGTSESYLHLFKLLCEPGDEILFPNPSYPLFDHIAKLANIKLSHYFLDAGNESWEPDLSELESKITAKTKAIVLISPNNPTGSVLAGQVLSGIVAIAEKYHLPIISDEVFSEFIFTKEPFARVASLARSTTVFTLNGISKTFALPGLKLSWIIATGPKSDEYLEELELSVDTLLACNQISQAMLPTILSKGQNFLQTYQACVLESRNTAMQILSQSPHINFKEPQGGFYIFAEIKNFRVPGSSPVAQSQRISKPQNFSKSATDEAFVIEMMKRAGIFVHPGYFYDYEKGIYVLISFLTEAGALSKILKHFVETTEELCSTG